MDHASYTIGWIAPLSLELTAARSAFDQEHGDVFAHGQRFLGGEIGHHKIILGVQSKMGTDAASALATTMKNAFPNIQFFLVVGIGGGVPRYGVAGVATEIVLGDVVVSYPVGIFGGVVRYDFGAWVDGGTLSFSGHTNGPPNQILGAVKTLQSDHSSKTGTKIPDFLKDMRSRIHHDERYKFLDPGPELDRLFDDEYFHPDTHQGVDCQQCCNTNFLQPREKRGKTALRQVDTPKIHYGNIGSSNQLQLSPAERNRLQTEHAVICFEMEGAGVIDKYPCLIVRGICDYSDSHKNKVWQPYAAVTAAAYTKELLKSMQPPDDHFTEKLSKDGHRLLADLRSTDPRDDKKRIEDTKGGLMKDLYRWILYDHEFRQWRHSHQSRLLWIKGDPGKGKTMLLCGIANELKSSLENGQILCYFFCQASDSRLNHATAVLRGLLFLLIDQQPSLISHVQTKYEKTGKALFEDANAWVALTEFLENIVGALRRSRVYFVVDALDECTDFPKLIDFIVRMSSTFIHAKWIVSSRNWPDIERRMDKAGHQVKLSLELNAEFISRAVDLYIQHKVLQLAHQEKYDTKTKTEVSEYLSANANDTFLWVSLVCQTLRDISPRKVLAKLKAFPPGLKPLYGRMLEQISGSDDSSLCKRILGLIAVIYRPISLSELTSLMDEPELYPDHDALETLREIITLCGSFLTIREDMVYFVHQSAKDFLIDGFEQLFQSGKEAAHYIVFSRSLNHLRTTLRRDIYDLRRPGYAIESVVPPEPDPLATSCYACVYWVDHFCEWSIQRFKGDSSYVHVIDQFIREKYLFWLEALSLLRAIPKGIKSLANLKRSIQDEDNADLVRLIQDAHRFIMYHKPAIETNPLQIYLSALAFSPAGSLIKECLKSEQPSWIKVGPVDQSWDSCLLTLEIRQFIPDYVVFSNDSSMIAAILSGPRHKTVKIWEASTGECLHTFTGYFLRPIWPRSIAFSPDSSKLVSNTGFMWDTATGECLLNVDDKEHSEAIPRDQDQRVYDPIAVFSPDSTLLALKLECCVTSMIKLWSTKNGDWLRTLEGHTQSVTSIAFSSQSSGLLASGSEDKTVKLWDIMHGKCIRTLEGHTGNVYYVAFSNDSTWVISRSEDGIVKTWSVDQGDCLQTLGGDAEVFHGVKLSNDSKWLMVLSDKFPFFRIHAWELIDKVFLQIWDIDALAITASFSHDSSQLVSVSTVGSATIWNTRTGDCLQTFQGHQSIVHSVAFSPDLTRVVSATMYHTIKLWDIGRDSRSNAGDTTIITEVALSHDLNMVASGSNHGMIQLWDANSGKCLQTLPSRGADFVIRSLNFSYDSTQLGWVLHPPIYLAENTQVKVWDIFNEQYIDIQQDLKIYVLAAAFRYDSLSIASLSEDGEAVILRDATSGRRLHELRHTEQIFFADFSSDAAMLASAPEFNPVCKLWNTENGQCFQTINFNYRLIGTRRLNFHGSGLFIFVGDEPFPIDDLSASNLPPATSTLQYRHHEYQGLCFSKDGSWLKYNAEKLLWIPHDYRLSCFAVSKHIIAVGTETGRVWICKIARDENGDSKLLLEV